MICINRYAITVYWVRNSKPTARQQALRHTRHRFDYELGWTTALCRYEPTTCSCDSEVSNIGSSRIILSIWRMEVFDSWRNHWHVGSVRIIPPWAFRRTDSLNTRGVWVGYYYGGWHQRKIHYSHLFCFNGVELLCLHGQTWATRTDIDLWHVLTENGPFLSVNKIKPHCNTLLPMHPSVLSGHTLLIAHW